MAFPATHAKRDVIVLQTSRGFASAPNSPRVFLHHASNNKRSDVIQTIHNADISNKLSNPSIDGMVRRICSLFPTAREYDVKELLVKYHYREAVVVSALQVLKYPLTMPGPAAVAAKNNNNYEATMSITTPPLRHLPTYYVPPSTQAAWSETLSDGRTSKLGAFSTNSNTPIHSPTPHRSPKIKLKYLKSVFPKAEETFLLDLLVCSDNNVNQVTQQLLTLGHEKKDKPQPLTPRRSLMTPPPVPKPVEVEASPKKLPSLAEMFQIKNELQELFPDEEEAVIQLALESADFDLDKAQIILTASQERDESFSTVKTLTLSGIKHTVTMSSLKSSPSVLSTFKDIASLHSPMKETALDEDDFRCKPKHTVLNEASEKCRGPDNTLLSEKYVRPNGPDRNMAKGPNASLLGKSSLVAKIVSKQQRVETQGPNPANRQGPKVKPRISLSSFISSKFKRESIRRI